MRGHYVCLHTNLHDQTNHFHLYVNVGYVNKPRGTTEGDVGPGFIICTRQYLIHWSHGWRFTTDIFYNPSTFKIGHSGVMEKVSPRFIHSLSLGQVFCAVRLDGSGARRSKCFLTTMKSRWCVFSNTSLFPFAVMLQSFWGNLDLWNCINLWCCLRCKDKKKKKMLSSGEKKTPKKTLMLYFMSSHYVSQAWAERTCLFPYLMQRIGSELMSVEWVLFALLPRWVVKEMESNARTAILSLPI